MEEKEYNWVLLCESSHSSYKEPCITFKGTETQVVEKVNEINSGKLSYVVVDFRKI